MNKEQTEINLAEVDNLVKDRIDVGRKHAAEEIADASKEVGLASAKAETTDQANSGLEPESKTTAIANLLQMPVIRIWDITEFQLEESEAA